MKKPMPCRLRIKTAAANRLGRNRRKTHSEYNRRLRLSESLVDQKCRPELVESHDTLSRLTFPVSWPDELRRPQVQDARCESDLGHQEQSPHRSERRVIKLGTNRCALEGCRPELDSEESAPSHLALFLGTSRRVRLSYLKSVRANGRGMLRLDFHASAHVRGDRHCVVVRGREPKGQHREPDQTDRAPDGEDAADGGLSQYGPYQ